MADTSGRALYLAWRPRRFDDVVGQRHVVRTIQNAVKNGTLAHAYLFSGPRGTGKTSMARLLFKAVNCLQPRDGAPCETCALCTSANEGRALDLIELDAASNRGIDDVRELRDKINYAPADAKYRVYILDEAHQLTQAAWDALLKTLEEPPPHAILVLATTEAHKVPATVLSRCQRFDFHRHSAADIRERLALIASSEGVVVEPTVLSWLARAARGGMRDAISLLDQLRAFCGERIDAASARDVLGLAGLETVRPFLEALQEDRPGDALEELNGALERGTDLRTFVGDVLTYLRALLLLRYGAVTSLRQELPLEELEWLEERSTEWPATRLRSLVGGFGDALARFRDPAQLLVQVELTLLGGWDAPDEGASPRPAARSTAHEAPTDYATGFVPARAARQAAMTPNEARGTESSTPTASAAPSSGPTASVAPLSTLGTMVSTSPADAIPAPPLNGSPTASTATRATATPVVEPPASVAPGPAAPVPDDADGGRPLWDDDDAAGAWSPGRPSASVPAPAAAHDDPNGLSAGRDSMALGGDAKNGATQPVVPLVPAPPGHGAGTTIVPESPVAPDAVNGTLPTARRERSAASAEPAGPVLDYVELRREWPSLRDALVGGRIERMVILGSAELVDAIGSTLVVKVGSGHLKLLDDDQKRRELRGDLTRALGRPADLRFVDEYVRPERPAAPAANGAAGHVVTPVDDPAALAAADPVIQCGLRLFGGPLVRVDVNSDQIAASDQPAASTPNSAAPAPQPAAPLLPPETSPSEAAVPSAPPTPAPPVAPLAVDEDDAEDTEDGAIIGRGGMPVRDWYNY